MQSIMLSIDEDGMVWLCNRGFGCFTVYGVDAIVKGVVVGDRYGVLSGLYVKTECTRTAKNLWIMTMWYIWSLF